MKKILLSLFVGLIGLINFGYCDLLTTELSNGTFTQGTNVVLYQSLSPGKSYCISINRSSCMFTQISYIGIGVPGGNGANYNVVTPAGGTVSLGKYLCFYDYVNNGTNLIVTTNGQGSCTNSYSLLEIGNFTDGSSSCPDCPVCDDPYTSLECQTEYNLIPISSVDENYCVNNGLCPTCPECPSGTGDYTGDLQYSNIYINNILHPGKQNIFINIPDYITWDYSQNEVDFNVYVGSGYDVDYINSIVDINSYRPTSEDFTNVFVSGLTLVFPYIFVALLILFIWKLLKRIFK